MTVTARVWDHMYTRTPSWDLGAVDPGLVKLLDEHPISGRAIDIGCGTGDNAVELARRGFDVVAVDVSPRAIEVARGKAKRACVDIEFRTDDITHGIAGPYDLIVDRGLLMSLAGERARRRYVRAVESLCAPNGVMYSAQWVALPSARNGVGARAVSRVSAVVLRPGEMIERFGAAFRVEVMGSALLPVHDTWIRRLGVREVRPTSYVLTRR